VVAGFQVSIDGRFWVSTEVLGAREFGDRRQREKVTLVLEREKYSFLKFCSDISGQDPEAHNSDPSEAVRIVRNWLRTHSAFGMPSADQMLRRFTCRVGIRVARRESARERSRR
jgi:hypothetical protein